MNFKRVLALVLALTMIFSLAMPSAWALDEDLALEDEYNEPVAEEDSSNVDDYLDDEKDSSAIPETEDDLIDEEPVEEHAGETVQNDNLSAGETNNFNAVTVADKYEGTSVVDSFSTVQDAVNAGGDIRINNHYDEDNPESITIPAIEVTLTGNGHTLGTVTVEDGANFAMQDATAGSILIHGDTTLNDVTTSVITVYGGSLAIPENDSGNYGEALIATGSTIEKGKVCGGRFDAISAALIAPGFHRYNGGVEFYGRAAINEHAYETLYDAVDAAQDGDTITLLCDPASVEDHDTHGHYGYPIVIQKKLTIDFNGYTYTVSQNPNAIDYAFALGSNDVTLNNGEISVAPDLGFKRLIRSDANLTIEDMVIDAENLGSTLSANVFYKGNLYIQGESDFTAAEGVNAIALQSDRGNVTATIDTTGSIDGVVVSMKNNNPITLDLNGSDIGNLTVNSNGVEPVFEDSIIQVTKAAENEIEVDDAYGWQDDTNLVKKYNVKFYHEGAFTTEYEDLAQFVMPGGTLEAFENPTISGYWLDEWRVDDQGTLVKFELDTPIATDTDLQAHFARNDYTVVFNKNADSAEGTMEDQPFKYGTAQNLTENAFTRTGYHFTGWNTVAAPTEENPGTPYADKASVNQLTTEKDGIVTLYAQWDPNHYAIIFDPNGGVPVLNPLPYTDFYYEVAKNLPANTYTKEGYSFKEWNTVATPTDAEGQPVEGAISIADEAEITTQFTGPGNTTLYAQWTADTFTIAFDKNAETATGTMTGAPATYDEALVLPAVGFVNNGCKFLGWALSAEATSPWASDASTLSTDNIAYLNGLAEGEPRTVTFYAVWAEQSVAQIDDVYYPTFVDAVRAAVNDPEKTIDLWQDPADGDVYGVNAANIPFVLNIRDGRTEPVKEIVGDLLIVNEDTLYFAEEGDEAVTYTLTKYEARLTDGTDTVKYYKTFDGTDVETAAVAEYRTNPSYYLYIETLVNIDYEMPLETWSEYPLVLAVKEFDGTNFTVRAADDSYTVEPVVPLPEGATKAYTVAQNIVTVEFSKERYLPTPVQGKYDWTVDPDLDPNEAVYTLKFESLESAVAKIRETRTAYVDGDPNKRVSVEINVYQADESLVLIAAGEEYTIAYADGCEPTVTTTVPNSEVEVSGTASPKTYKVYTTHTITYYLDDGTNAETNPATFTMFDNTITLADATKEHYDFNGWTWWWADIDRAEKGGLEPAKTPIDIHDVDKDIAVWANFSLEKHELSFEDTDGGELYEDLAQTKPFSSVEAIYGTSLEWLIAAGKIKTPAKEGFTFVKWTVNGEEIEDSYAFTEDTTLVPVWEIATPTVTFVNQTAGGGEINKIYSYPASYGTHVIDPGDPMNPIDPEIEAYTYKGYRFDKWYADAAMTEVFDFAETTVPMEGLTIYGRFLKDTYTLYFDWNDAEIPPAWTQGDAIEYTIDSGVEREIGGTTYKVIVLPVPVIEGYSFEGWRQENGTLITDGYYRISHKVGNVTVVDNAQTETLTAEFRGSHVRVRFIDGNKTLLADMFRIGSKINERVPLGRVEAQIDYSMHEGYTLVPGRQWQNVDDDTVFEDGIDIYHLNWLEEHEVTFFANGVELTTITVPDGELVGTWGQIPEVRISGDEAVWHIDSEEGEVFAIASEGVYSDLELYATFAEQVEVTFVVGEARTSEKVIVGETVAQPEDPKKDGYDFVGWFVVGADEKFDFDTPITAPITLNAVFTETAELFKDVKFSASAQLSESINLNLKMYNIPADTDIEDYSAIVTVGDNDPVTNYFTESDTPGTYKTIAERAYAFQMNVPVTMEVYYKDILIKTVDGYSLRKYFENRFAATSGLEQTMFKTALDYGAQAQSYFDVETDNLANSTVNPGNTLEAVDRPADTAKREGVIDGITSYKASLIMDSEISVKFKINADSLDGIAFSVPDGYKYTVSPEPVDGYYEITVTGYTPLSLNRSVTLSISKGNELVTIEYSPFAYANSKWTSTEKNGTLANLVKSMVAFSDAVIRFFPV